MNVSDFFNQFQLHDCGVENIVYSPERAELRLYIEMCNYDQLSYNQGDPQMVGGWLLFLGVSDLTSKPGLSSIQWDRGTDGEILRARLDEPADGKDKPNLIFTISLFKYITKARDVLVLEFRARDVEWLPVDKSHSRPNP